MCLSLIANKRHAINERPLLKTLKTFAWEVVVNASLYKHQPGRLTRIIIMHLFRNFFMHKYQVFSKAFYVNFYAWKKVQKWISSRRYFSLLRPFFPNINWEIFHAVQSFTTLSSGKYESVICQASWVNIMNEVWNDFIFSPFTSRTKSSNRRPSLLTTVHSLKLALSLLRV